VGDPDGERLLGARRRHAGRFNPVDRALRRF